MINSYKTRIITSVIVVGIMAGVSTGYYFKHKDNIDSTVKTECSLASFTDEDMSSMAASIAKGKVLSISDAKWNTTYGIQPSKVNIDDMLYREVIIKADQVYKGSIKNDTTIKIRVYGGSYYENGQKYEVLTDISPKFSKDESVIVFLAEDDSSYNKNKANDYYIVLGSRQGKYSVNNEQLESTERKLAKKDLESKIENYKNTEPRIKKGTGKI